LWRGLMGTEYAVQTTSIMEDLGAEWERNMQCGYLLLPRTNTMDSQKYCMAGITTAVVFCVDWMDLASVAMSWLHLISILLWSVQLVVKNIGC